LSDQHAIANLPEPGAFIGGDRVGGFGRFGHDDIVDLPRIVGAEKAVRAELLPAMALLGRRSATDFATLATLYAALPGPARQPSAPAVRALRELFLNIVDRRLQRLYRRHFQQRPPEPGARHAEKIAQLQAVRTEAHAMVQSYDWPWLAHWLDLPRIGEDAETCLRRLSNFAFDVGRVNFRFSYHCNIACRHCYNHSGPDQKALRLELEPMLAIIAQMPDAGVDALNLSGGEPFLYPDLLEALIAAGRTAGLREISIFSNGFWATSEAKARQTLMRLASAGFLQGPDDYLKLSSGVYHQEFIDFRRMAVAARAYHALFGRRLKLDVELPAGEATPPKDYARRIIAEGVGDMVELGFRPIAPLGRAADLARADAKRADAPCDDINQIVFDPDGLARPCCGLNNDNHGVVIGALGRQTLRALIKSMQNDPVLQFIAHKPLATIRDHMDSPPDPGPHASCTTCQATIGGLRDKESLQARLFDLQRFYPFWFTPAG
jgi:hypothetical protein